MVLLFILVFLAAAGCGAAMLLIHKRERFIGSTAGHKLFLFEFAVLVVPYLVLVGIGSVALIVAGLAGGIGGFLVSLAIASAMVTPMICGFYMSRVFIRGGGAALRQMASLWWWGAGLGAAIPIAGLLALVLKAIFGDFPIQAESDDQPFGPARISQLSLGLVVAPLLVPMFHLLLERYGSSRSNKSLERTREG